MTITEEIVSMLLPISTRCQVGKKITIYAEMYVIPDF